MKFGIGQPVKRREDRRFLTGQGRYVEDLITDDTLALHILRSPIARGSIVAMNCTDAKAVPGVRAVLTGEDYRKDGLGGIAEQHAARDRFDSDNHGHVDASVANRRVGREQPDRELESGHHCDR